MPRRGWVIPNPTHMEVRTTSPLTRLQQFCRTHRQTLLQTYVVALPSSSYLLSLGTGPATLFQLLSGSLLQLSKRRPSRLQASIPYQTAFPQTPASRIQKFDPSSGTEPVTPSCRTGLLLLLVQREEKNLQVTVADTLPNSFTPDIRLQNAEA